MLFAAQLLNYNWFERKWSSCTWRYSLRICIRKLTKTSCITNNMFNI